MDTQEKSVVVLVHGIGSSKGVWSQFLSLLRADEVMTERFEFEPYGYDTPWLNLRISQRIPRLTDLADGLKTFLNDTKFQDREITLVGHSQGGLVIHAYLAYMVKQGWGPQLAPIRQVVTLATPHWGSEMVSGLRRFVGIFFKNSQLLSLRVLDPDTAEIVNTVKDRIAETEVADNTHWPIPVYCFVGMSDGVVREASARGPFSNYATLKADHKSILEPKNREDEIYRAFTQRLLEPPGKANEFEIDSFETTLTVRPVPADVPQVVQHGRKCHEVLTDNVAVLDRVIRFSASNRRIAPFEIEYSTLGDGFVKYVCLPPNEAPSEEIIDYEMHGKRFYYRFTPKLNAPLEKYSLQVTFYKGYDKGNREIHFHLGHDRYYHKFTFSLDLRAYTSAGYLVTKAPEFRFSEKDPGVCDSCKDIFKLVDEVPPKDTGEPGLWRWELNRVRQGMTFLSWDVALSSAGQNLPDPAVES
jgi:pimeloyl-ACP methyl ester carboxylesterase